MPNLTDVLEDEDEITVQTIAKDVTLAKDGTGEMEEGKYIILNIADGLPSGFKLVAPNGDWLDNFIHGTGKVVSFDGVTLFQIDENNTNALHLSLNGLLWDNERVLVSNPNATGADAITNIMSLTQTEYDAIGTPDPATLYVINGA